MKKISMPFGNFQIIYFPALLLAVLLILSAFSFKIGISKIVKLQDSVNSQKNTELVLQQKEELLRSAEGNLPDQANIASIALPEKNPILFSMYHIKNLGMDGLVVLSDIKVGSVGTGDSGINKISISFDIKGQMTDVINSINKLKNVAPLIILDAADFRIVSAMPIEGTSADANVSVSSFWSPFPDKIPSLTQPLSDITSGEKDILKSLLSLTRSSFDQLLPQGAVERENPF
ncbi:MAG: hypothetical protein Q8P91_00480 [bacterium]|nr:hypothetical protein [bacterium]